MALLDMGDCTILDIGRARSSIKLIFLENAYAGFILEHDSKHWTGWPLHRPDGYKGLMREWSWQAVWDVLDIERKALAT